MIDMQMKGRNAIVTGASKGIGLAIATNFAMAGANIIIVGRRMEALEQAKDAIVKAGQTKVVMISADVSKAEDPRLNAVNKCHHVEVEGRL